MKYKNATEILPDKLLIEVQKYINGETLYIPNVKTRKKWGEGSGARAFYENRNHEIIEKYKSGLKLDELANRYCLSIESIKKILHK